MLLRNKKTIKFLFTPLKAITIIYRKQKQGAVSALLSASSLIKGANNYYTSTLCIIISKLCMDSTHWQNIWSTCINFHGVQISWMSQLQGLLILKTVKFYVHHIKIMRLCHKNINLWNYLSFSNHKKLNPQNLLLLCNHFPINSQTFSHSNCVRVYMTL